MIVAACTWTAAKRSMNLGNRPHTMEENVIERFMYRIPEVVELTSLGRTVIYRELAAGHLRSVTVGRRRLIPHEALMDFIEHLRADQWGHEMAAEREAAAAE
jgi:excisionase family DNA binding protein